MLPSSNGGADGAIGVCSLNLLGGVSGMRFGVLPSDMFLQCVIALRQQQAFTAAKELGSFLAMDLSTTASDYRSRQARLRLRKLPDADSTLWLRASTVTY